MKVSETDTAIAHLYGYTGREFDSQTSLQYNRARYYDPKLGRWLQQDPMGFEAGDTNLYRYVGNHGSYASDPSGLTEEWYRYDWTDWVNPVAWYYGLLEPEKKGTGIGSLAEHSRNSKQMAQSRKDAFDRLSSSDGHQTLAEYDGTNGPTTNGGVQGMKQSLKNSQPGMEMLAEQSVNHLSSAGGYVGIAGVADDVIRHAPDGGGGGGSHRGPSTPKGSPGSGHTPNGNGGSHTPNGDDSIVRGPVLPLQHEAAKAERQIVQVSPDQVRFSQDTVSFKKENGLTCDDIKASMEVDGWRGDPIDVVVMPDRKLTSVDNTRVRAARETNCTLTVTIHHPDELLTAAEAERFTTRQKVKSWFPGFGKAEIERVPRTWGEAVQFRIEKQSEGFANSNPLGSNELPRVTGRPKE